jgi:hypothetical protein
VPRALRLPLCAAVPALEVSRGDNLKRIDVQRLVGNNPLQATIFVLKRSHLRDVADVHATKLRFPLVESRATNAEFTTDIGGLGAGLRLLDRRDDLAFGESGFLHVRLLARRWPLEFALFRGILSRAHVSACTRTVRVLEAIGKIAPQYLVN